MYELHFGHLTYSCWHIDWKEKLTFIVHNSFVLLYISGFQLEPLMVKLARIKHSSVGPVSSMFSVDSMLSQSQSIEILFMQHVSEDGTSVGTDLKLSYELE